MTTTEQKILLALKANSDPAMRELASKLERIRDWKAIDLQRLLVEMKAQQKKTGGDK